MTKLDEVTHYLGSTLVAIGILRMSQKTDHIECSQDDDYRGRDDKNDNVYCRFI